MAEISAASSEAGEMATLLPRVFASPNSSSAVKKTR